ncbi:hypothetical protein L9F63_025070 [Diploptera punctata]|uniref:Uncharacterized protein n=1 Tax=Diploptera punctata TaxID=6984 RepID=A0AAD7ZD15_DIPPU|nr:hypothetical protein L9F63_025070 [Diploptera punctata]
MRILCWKQCNDIIHYIEKPQNDEDDLKEEIKKTSEKIRLSLADIPKKFRRDIAAIEEPEKRDIASIKECFENIRKAMKDELFDIYQDFKKKELKAPKTNP